MECLGKLNLQMESLVIFRNLLNDKVVKNLMDMLSFTGKSNREILASYASFTHNLFQSSEDLTEYLWKLILADENIYVMKRASNQRISSMMDNCLTNELNILQQLARIKSEDIISRISYEGYLPRWTNSDIDFALEYRKRMDNIATIGYGIFADYWMFTFEDDNLMPVESPDPVRLTDLWGYERQRQRVIDNTLALLSGKPSSDVLLYGDAGTGKSSTVKAIVNEYGHRGLRLVEVRKPQLLRIPNLVERLCHNPLKFIIFIDDLSYAQSNEEIGALKAILEGSVATKSSNIAIYATSNRRHLVKETFSERGDDDIHISETIQEQTSLSERFGLSVGFFKPNRDEYIEMVFELAKQYELKNTDNLELLAERYALERGGRSGRCARQLVEYLKSMED